MNDSGDNWKGQRVYLIETINPKWFQVQMDFDNVVGPKGVSGCATLRPLSQTHAECLGSAGFKPLRSTIVCVKKNDSIESWGNVDFVRPCFASVTHV
jgi:hypothetical protein